TQDWQESVIGLTELVQVERFTGLYLDHDESFNLLDMDEGRLSDAQLMLDPAGNRKLLLFNYPVETAPAGRQE
ncbi:MAG: hypothetical protein IKO80_08120, partial [Lachnospiraceae bacterium]|nr:hypothetical protein [Lachnospiraceae bacterium]